MMRRALRTGLVAASLLATPAGGQELELSHPFDIGHFSDDLVPMSGPFAFSTPHEAQLRLVGTQIPSSITATEFQMIAVAVDDYGDEVPDDFAVLVESPPLSGRTYIHVVEFPVPSVWYQRLFETRFPEAMKREGREAHEIRRAGLDVSMQDYTDTRIRPGDGAGVRALKEKIALRKAARKLTMCEIRVDDDMLERLDPLYGMIARARSRPEMIMGLSFETVIHRHDFSFSYSHASGRTGGAMMINSRPEMMVAATLAMRDYCRQRDAKSLEALRQALARVKKRLPDDSKYETPPIPKN